ncbi:Harbinger transposase-derived nuclease domain-containing protein [Rozella allomycis CSF55]|uniref:Harbinger transposase-derived nuclease domain-containing protein n=1 Tax=Rozella allomycis (strain CSF55) TaxID=988480 RepID=A0A075AUM1_ROZAC|nr:Harbinger transposase-derived nuclease domain-containing protein [Rozella allomycis CSF55]|eukprot:EPZ33860.1 Harbinger transposase-derived nuclease domain-containing protein [Rozella allomycis CSF55]
MSQAQWMGALLKLRDLPHQMDGIVEKTFLVLMSWLFATPKNTSIQYPFDQGVTMISPYGIEVSAVDGSLIEIERPTPPDGWYCRKNFPAFNVMTVCDLKNTSIQYRFDQGFGQLAPTVIPRGYHILGDSGYALKTYLLTPFDQDHATPEQKNYNYIHSATRNVIERALGDLKSRWRFLRRPSDLKSIECNVSIVQACFVLHNLCIKFGDRTVLDDILEHEAEVDEYALDNIYHDDDSFAKAKRDYISHMTVLDDILEHEAEVDEYALDNIYHDDDLFAKAKRDYISHMLINE